MEASDLIKKTNPRGPNKKPCPRCHKQTYQRGQLCMDCIEDEMKRKFAPVSETAAVKQFKEIMNKAGIQFHGLIITKYEGYWIYSVFCRKVTRTQMKTLNHNFFDVAMVECDPGGTCIIEFTKVISTR